MSPLVLRELDDLRDGRWDAYVRGHAQGTFYHLLGWRRVIERAFPHRAHYLYVERDDRLAGVLPLFAAGAMPFSRALVSVPIGVGGGVLADDPESARLLRDGARAVAERETLAYVEYKSEKKAFEDLPTKDDLYFGFRQELFGDRERQLAAIPRKSRAVLREAERARLRFCYNRDDLEPFYDLYALSLRNLGTPMFPKELFVACLEEFPEHCNLAAVRESGRIVGVVMNFYFRDVMLPFFAGIAPDVRDIGVNSYIYWAMLETGYDLGYRVLDMGRSKKDTGPFKFKRNLGFVDSPLEYQYDLVSRQELPNINPTNPKYARAIEAWKRLPVELTKRVGPMLSRRLP